MPFCGCFVAAVLQNGSAGCLLQEDRAPQLDYPLRRGTPHQAGVGSSPCCKNMGAGILAAHGPLQHAAWSTGLSRISSC